jgi:TRAP-type C4-dicarboxylate transport system permease large subunit
VTNTMSGATRGGLGGALVGASFPAGYMVGSALYDYLS